MQHVNEITARRITRGRRNGNIIVLSAVMMVIVFGFAAFAIDVGYMSMTRSQLQNAADAAVLAGGMDLIDGLGPQPSSSTTVASNARQAAVNLAAENAAGDLSQVYLDISSDVELGRRRWDASSQSWSEDWDQRPYDLIRVTARRNQPHSSNGDRTLPLFFATILGSNTASLSVAATATISPGSGFRILSNSESKAPVLPIVLDEPTWIALMAGIGSDDYSYGPNSGTVANGSDGIKEANLYPSESPDLPSGNRGTVDFGGSNNSTSDLSRQIRHGLNESDLSHFSDGTLTTDNGPIQLSGDTGISAGFKDDLKAIIGEPRAIPLFTTVSGPGDNATYTIVRFVGVRIVHVDLTGRNKSVIIQPASVIGDTIVPGTSLSTTTYVYSMIRLIQ